MKNKKLLTIFCQSFIFTILFSQTYPVIPKLDSRNDLFKQYQEDVEYQNKLMATRKNASATFYLYRAEKDDTLIRVAARCGVPYETISTCNGITGSEQNIEGDLLYLSTATGLFIPENPENIMEMILSKQYLERITENPPPVYNIGGRKYFFLQNERFDQAARAFFLDSSMRLPLKESVLSSSYGMRVSPISGQWKMHHGIDMAAPEGTPVYSCKAGTATIVKHNDSVYGNYILITHKDGMTSLYAHLSEILVSENQNVGTGTEIGRVGQTGLATGPHLHFEIRVKGEYTDPSKFF